MVIRSVFLKKIACFLSALLFVVPAYPIEKAKPTDGLTLWNRVARSINTYIVEPCAYTSKLFSEYHVREAFGFSLILLTITCAYWFENCGKNIDTRQSSYLANFLKNRFGPAPLFNESTNSYTLDGFNTTENTWWNGSLCSIYNWISKNPLSIAAIGGTCIVLQDEYNEYRKNKAELSNQWKKFLGISTQEKQELFMNLEYSPSVGFEHLIGLDHIKAQLLPTMQYAENPAEYSKNNNSLTTNFLFYGASYTGKTFFAHALMQEIRSVNRYIRTFFIPINLLQTIDLQQLKNLLQACAPCIVLIDKVDNNLSNDALELLGCPMSPSPDRPVFVISTTNKIGPVDGHIESHIKELTEAGKWNIRSILFSTPSLEDRIQTIERSLQGCGYEPKNFDILLLANKMDGYTFNGIKGIIGLADHNARYVNNTSLTDDLIIEVIDAYAKLCLQNLCTTAS